MKKIDKSWIKPLFLGSVYLGTGGGGKTNNAVYLLEELFSSNVSVPLIPCRELENGKYYAGSGLVGSPTLLDDFLFSGHESMPSINKLAKITNSEITGLYTLECAGINALYPLFTAVLSGLPLIDGDCISTAFPELQMTTLHINNIPLSPFCLSDIRGNVTTFYEEDTFMLELKIRNHLASFSNVGFFSCGMLKGETLKRSMIPNTVTHAMEIGRVFMECTDYSDLLSRLVTVTKNSVYGAAIELFKGKILEIDDTTNDNWQILKIMGIESYSSDNYRILMKNEFIAGFKNDSISVMVPDLISLIDMDTLMPVDISELKPQMKVSVIGMPAPLPLKTPTALSIVGPSSFGYKRTYKALEELYFDYYY